MKIPLAGQKDLRRIRAIQWGITHGTEGLKAGTHTIKKPILPCGFFLSECGVLGASPDGIVDDDYIVEIKCPYKFRNCKLTEALRDDRSYVFYYNDMGQLSLNKMHPYYHQVQGQIHLSQRKGCYLCVWTPKQAICCLILKDVNWCSNMTLMTNFYFDKYIPFLLSLQ